VRAKSENKSVDLVNGAELPAEKTAAPCRLSDRTCAAASLPLGISLGPGHCHGATHGRDHAPGGGPRLRVGVPALTRRLPRPFNAASSRHLDDDRPQLRLSNQAGGGGMCEATQHPPARDSVGSSLTLGTPAASGWLGRWVPVGSLRSRGGWPGDFGFRVWGIRFSLICA
jgi:hypothetical protein